MGDGFTMIHVSGTEQSLRLRRRYLSDQRMNASMPTWLFILFLCLTPRSLRFKILSSPSSRQVIHFWPLLHLPNAIPCLLPSSGVLTRAISTWLSRQSADQLFAADFTDETGFHGRFRPYLEEIWAWMPRAVGDSQESVAWIGFSRLFPKCLAGVLKTFVDELGTISWALSASSFWKWSSLVHTRKLA
jgi:hypothetical protein